MLIIQVLFFQRIIRKEGGDTEKMSEINNNSTEKIAIEPEEIGSTTEKIDENSEKITSETEKIPEIIPEKKKSKGERGPDKNKRRFNPNSYKNLMQNKNKIFEEKKPIWKKPVFWLGVGGTILAVATGCACSPSPCQLTMGAPSFGFFRDLLKRTITLPDGCTIRWCVPLGIRRKMGSTVFLTPRVTTPSCFLSI